MYILYARNKIIFNLIKIEFYCKIDCYFILCILYRSIIKCFLIKF